MARELGLDKGGGYLLWCFDDPSSVWCGVGGMSVGVVVGIALILLLMLC